MAPMMTNIELKSSPKGKRKRCSHNSFFCTFIADNVVIGVDHVFVIGTDHRKTSFIMYKVNPFHELHVFHRGAILQLHNRILHHV